MAEAGLHAGAQALARSLKVDETPLDPRLRGDDRPGCRPLARGWQAWLSSPRERERGDVGYFALAFSRICTMSAYLRDRASISGVAP